MPYSGLYNYEDLYSSLVPAAPLLERIGSFLSSLGAGKKATLESIKDPYGISDMDDPVIPSFVSRDTPAPPESSPESFPQRFDNTLAGQYQRYFKTPEFDRVFGAGARGTGAPEDAAAMEVLGNQLMAPKKDTNIASMYAAQSAMGRVNQDKIQDYFADTSLPGNVKLKDGRTALQAWAEENPMLAQREYLKAEAKRADNAPMAPDGETMLMDLGGKAQFDNPMGNEAYNAIRAAKEKLMQKAGSK